MKHLILLEKKFNDFNYMEAILNFKVTTITQVLDVAVFLVGTSLE